MRFAPFITGAALALALPVVAQGPSPDAAMANGAAQGTVAAQPATGVRPADQAAYEADLEVYRAEVRATDRANRYSIELAARQERAYADAMRAWRMQVAECRRGHTAACRAPTPRPGDFM